MLDVKVKIDMAKTYGSLGFGYPLILIENAEAAITYKVYSDITTIATDYASTTDAYKVAQLMFAQPHRPEKIAICSDTGTVTEWLAKDANVSKDWRQLVVLNGSSSETATTTAAIAAAIEALSVEKMFFANESMPTSLSSATAPSGAFGWDRTVMFYYTPIQASTGSGNTPAVEAVPLPVAALVGEIAGLTPGSYTVNNLVLNGIEPLELSQDDIDKIHSIGGITFVSAAGDNVCSEGKTASGEFIDNVDNNDYIKQQLEYKTQKVLNGSLKVPYTNAGIALLEAAAISVMKNAQNLGIVEDYTVTYALREQTSAEDRAARKYFGGNVQYSMQGAIHTVEIYCQATV